MAVESTLVLLKALPEWEFGKDQENSLLNEEDRWAALQNLRKIAFQLEALVDESDEGDCLESFKILAFRNLAAEGAVEDVHEIMNLLCELDYHDPDFGDAVVADLDWLMATFGDVAVDPLSEVLSNIGMEEILRMYCATSLVSIAKNGHRSDEIWALFRELLRKRPLHRAVNGIMLSEMATHLGKEAAEFVLEIYDTNVVDVTHCGDRENLEVEMGIRKERDTPRPHLGELEAERKAAYFKQELGPLPEDASPEQILQYFLIVYERPRAAKDVAMLHGALSVLVASPQMAPPSAISTIVWDLRAGDPSQTPIWDGMEEAQLFMNALMVFYNQIASSLGTRGFGPYLRELEEGLGYDEPIDLEGPLFSLENWAEGISDAGDYLEKIQGPSEFTTALRELSDELLVETIKYPVMDSEQVGISSFEMVDFLGETRESQQGMLMNPQSSVMGFPEGLSSFDLPPTEQVIRDAPKIGRNDLCPCGSGKKYKRCCAN